MNDVVDAGTCCECGACVLACPHNVIEYIDGKPKQTAKESAAFDYRGVSEGAGCDVCAAVCPREQHPRDEQFGDDRPYEDIFGVFRNIFVARSTWPDLAAAGQDGGIVTALLTWAQAHGHIDGAIVSAVGAEDDACFPTPKIVTSEAEIKASTGSWSTYCPTIWRSKKPRRVTSSVSPSLAYRVRSRRSEKCSSWTRVSSSPRRRSRR